ncbi:MAG: hypothetical protein ACPGUD_06230 [Parashewanella sp.]
MPQYKTQARKKQPSKKGLGSHYSSRLDIASRVCLASLGGYGLAVLFTVSLSLRSQQDAGINTMSATQNSFLVMTAIAIWAFCAPTAKKAWIVTSQVAIAIAVYGGISYVF